MNIISWPINSNALKWNSCNIYLINRVTCILIYTESRQYLRNNNSLNPEVRLIHINNKTDEHCDTPSSHMYVHSFDEEV